MIKQQKICFKKILKLFYTLAHTVCPTCMAALSALEIDCFV